MDLSQVTLTQFRYAIAIAETKSFRAAAERSFISQPGLSMQIQKLEELLGVVLFDRSKKPLLLTQEGEAAIEQMRTILRETERLGQIVQQEESLRGPYRLGVIPTLSPTILPLFLPEFVKNYPEMSLHVEELQTHELIERLLEDRIDGAVAATPLNMPGLDEFHLGYERLLAYLPEADPLLRKKVVQQNELAQRPLWVMPEGHCFRTQVLTYCESSRQKRRERQEPPAAGVHFESGSFETLIRLVDEGLGATVLPELVARGLPAERWASQIRLLDAPVPVREIGFVTARTQLKRRMTEVLSSTIRDALQRALQQQSKQSLSDVRVLVPSPSSRATPEEDELPELPVPG